MIQISIVATVVCNFELDANDDQASEWLINSKATATGLGYAKFDAELVGPNGNVKVRIQDAHLAPYEGAQQLDSYQRHPMLRVLWKPVPSPGLMTDRGLTSYLKSVVEEPGDNLCDRTTSNLMSCLSIIGHKNPYSRVLELGAGKFAKTALEALSGNSIFPQLHSYTIAKFNDDNQLAGFNVDLQTGEPEGSEIIPPELQFDLIILPDSQESGGHLVQRPKELKARLGAWGSILAVSPPRGNIPLTKHGLVAIRSKSTKDQEILFIHRMEDVEIKVDSDASTAPVLVVEYTPTTLGDIFVEEISRVTGRKPMRMLPGGVSKDTVSTKSQIISLLEINNSVLSVGSEFELSRIKVLTEQASRIMWVTAGNLLNSQTPDRSLMFGLSRAIMAEQPGLEFYVSDVDDLSAHLKRTARNILSIFTRTDPGIADREFIQRDGVAHVSRFIPDDGLNEAFRRSQGATVQLPLEQAQNVHLKSPQAVPATN
ncbi:hypothetical protein TWF696_006666 [Orbilia brochopaga]|uniref:Uncharacterized protein n=1 Tax=Orbilia brochopaga TaxID=3140254 RepID=A0AAV9UPH8_9PEZI